MKDVICNSDVFFLYVEEVPQIESDGWIAISDENGQLCISWVKLIGD